MLSIYHPCGHAVCSAAREPEQEFGLADSDDEDDTDATSSAKTVMRLVPRKLRKALDREVPWDLIPEHQRPQYEAAIKNALGREFSAAPLKGRARAAEKARNEYDTKPAPATSWLFDLVRGSVICDTEDELVGLIRKLDADKGVEIVRNRR